jgi:hypothetical protein
MMAVKGRIFAHEMNLSNLQRMCDEIITMEFYCLFFIGYGGKLQKPILLREGNARNKGEKSKAENSRRTKIGGKRVGGDWFFVGGKYRIVRIGGNWYGNEEKLVGKKGGPQTKSNIRGNFRNGGMQCSNTDWEQNRINSGNWCDDRGDLAYKNGNVWKNIRNGGMQDWDKVGWEPKRAFRELSYQKGDVRSKERGCGRWMVRMRMRGLSWAGRL